MSKKDISQIERLAFAIFSRARKIRKKFEKDEEHKKTMRAKLTVIEGGKVD